MSKWMSEFAGKSVKWASDEMDLLAHRAPPRSSLTVELQVRLQIKTLQTDRQTVSRTSQVLSPCVCVCVVTGSEATTH